MDEQENFHRNPELFAAFYDAQRRFVLVLARHPALVAGWLRLKGLSELPEGKSSAAAKNWRTARLSGQRRRELGQFVEAAASGEPAAVDALAAWLLARVPVSTYLEIAALAEPSLAAHDGEAPAGVQGLMILRNRIFLANYGLAKSAAATRRQQEYGDRLSAACSGLLDAIDRYVPGERSARFGFFAGFWIRYHIGRHVQKNGCVVSYPIHQHRIGRKVDRYVEGRRGGEAGDPTATDIQAAVGVGAEAFYWHTRRPFVVSIEGDETDCGHLLQDPAPSPSEEAGTEELEASVGGWLRRKVPPITRVALAYACGIGSLPLAAAEYLAHCGELARSE
jgi:hypothetical protein